MAVSLSKGGNVSLSKEAPGLKAIMAGLGWDARATDGAEFDLDASVFIVGENGKIRSDNDFVFYNNKITSDGSVEHLGDNQTGAGDGDDESVKVNLDSIAADVKRIIFAVTIHEAGARKQNFGMVQNAFMRVMDASGGKEIVRYDLSEDYSTETALIFGEVYRAGAEWKFKAVGQGFVGGLAPLAKEFGVNLG